MASGDVRIKQILKERNIPLPSDFDERLDLLIKGLRRDPTYEQTLQAFKARQNGGALPPMDSEDWLGPNVINFLDVITSPAARGVLKGLFMIIFFISYLESIPVFGSILGAALDIMVAGSKAITKTIQRNLPPLVGLLPIPYASMFGLVLAAVYGAFVWPMIALVAFSRQDFAAAVESFIRSVPPPFGDTLADNFMELNRVVARIDGKRKKIVNDITTALLTVSDLIEKTSARIQSTLDMTQNVQRLQDRIKQASAQPMEAIKQASVQPMQAIKQASAQPMEAIKQASVQPIQAIKQASAQPIEAIKQASAQPKTEFPPVPVGQGRKRLSTKRRSKHKWPKKRTKSVKR